MVAKRNASYSNVVVVETNDNKRFNELRRYLDEEKRKMLIYDVYAGLTKRVNKEETPVTEDKPKGLSGLLSEKDPMDEINALLVAPNSGDNPDQSKTDEVAIVKNILEMKDVPMKAVNFWATEDNALENGRTLVLFVAGRDLIDPRVLDKCILVTPPLSLPMERKAILSKMCVNVYDNLALSPEQIDGLVNLTAGLDLNQVDAVFIETLTAYMTTKAMDFGVVAKTKSDIVEKSGLLKMMTPKYGFEGVGGYDAVKDYIIESIIKPLKEPERAREIGVEPPRGAIIFGPPGTGKTIISKAIGFMLKYPMVSLSPENFMNSLVGETERNLRRVIKIIEEMAPIIVLMDEIDRYGGRGGPGGENDGGTSSRVFSQLLEYLGDEDRKAFIIGTTNAPAMDEAFRREGRVDVMIPMMSPDLNARLAILKIHLNVRRKIKNKVSEEKLAEIAVATQGWKGNMLEELCKRAVRLAFNKSMPFVSDEVLQETLDDYKVNTKALTESEGKYMEMAEQFCNSQKFLVALKKATVANEGTGREAFIKRKKGLAGL